MKIPTSKKQNPVAGVAVVEFSPFPKELLL